MTKKKMESGGSTRKRAVAKSYDLQGNEINVPQNQYDFQNFGSPQPIAPTPNKIYVGGGQYVTQDYGMDTGIHFQPSPVQNAGQSDMGYSPNQDGSFSINTDYLNNYMTGGKRGYDAYGTYDRNTNRKYAHEGIYGSRRDFNDLSIFKEGGKVKADQVIVDSKNDPRYKAYQDSLSLHDMGQKNFMTSTSGSYGTNPGVQYFAGEDLSYAMPEYEGSYPKLMNTSKKLVIKPTGRYLTEGNIPFFSKPSQEVVLRPPPAQLPPKNFNSFDPVQGHPYAWDMVTENGVFPTYGTDNKLQGMWDRKPDGQTLFYPQDPGQQEIPKGLPPNTQIRSSGRVMKNIREREYGGLIGFAENGWSNNPYMDPNMRPQNSMDWFYNQQPPQQMSSVPLQQMPVNNNQMQAQPLAQAPYQGQQSAGSSNPNYGNIAGGIQAGVEGIGGLFAGANNLRNQLILGGSSLINGLLQDQHNVRKKVPVLSDPTLAYQPQFNNMMEFGGNIQQPGMVVNTAYKPGDTVDLTPEEVKALKKAGYEFEIIG